jgi:hypothetical protein
LKVVYIDAADTEGKNVFGVEDRSVKLKKNNDKTPFKHSYEGRTITEKQSNFFPTYGLGGIKEKPYQAMIDSKQNNILLSGPCSFSQDMFLIKIRDQCNDTIYYEPALEKTLGLGDHVCKKQKLQSSNNRKHK